MLQIWNALSETTVRLAGEYGPPVAVGVAVVVGVAIVLRLLGRALK
jgi:hypothetical protein